MDWPKYSIGDWVLARGEVVQIIGFANDSKGILYVVDTQKPGSPINKYHADCLDYVTNFDLILSAIDKRTLHKTSNEILLEDRRHSEAIRDIKINSDIRRAKLLESALNRLKDI